VWQGIPRLHPTIEVVAGGKRIGIPAPSPIVVCVGVVTEGWGNNPSIKSVSVELCPYPLIVSE
jgi:hypothetical protein